MTDIKPKKLSTQPTAVNNQIPLQQTPKTPIQTQSQQKENIGSRSFLKSSEENMISLDNDLVELRQKYIEARNARKIVERDEKCVLNKMELLSNKEKEAENRCNARAKNQKNFDNVKEDIKKQKDKLEELRRKNEELLKIKREKVNAQKNKTKIILAGWRMKNAEKKKGDGTKKYSEKKEIEKAIELEKEKVKYKNMYLHDQVKANIAQIEKKKKDDELERKIRKKKELEEKINEELNKRKDLQEKIDDYNAKSVQINERIKDLENMGTEMLNTSPNVQTPGLINLHSSKSKDNIGGTKQSSKPRLFSPNSTTKKSKGKI